MKGMNDQHIAERAMLHRRALHAIPEAGLDLPDTIAYVRRTIGATGFKAVDCGGGLVVDIGCEGPLVAMRADMDGLPITEETGLPFASAHHGMMHACGHDAHTGALLACAEAYSASPPEGFRVRLLFQPGEEGWFGARPMIAAGCLDGVSAIVGGHVGNLSEELEPGQAGFMPGPMMASSDMFEGAFVGSGGHGAAPHQARDPIPALAEFVMSLQAFRNRAPDQRKPFVVSVCELSAGSTYNVIPGEARFKGTARTLEPFERALARTGIERVCAGVAAVHGLGHGFTWIEGYPPLTNDAKATGIAMEAVAGVLGQVDARTMTIPSMGGEDFAFYLARVPGCFWFFNTQSPEKGIVHPNHHPRFDVDDSLLGCFAQANMAAAEALARAYPEVPIGSGASGNNGL
ncbi:MAG: amidohydrolase [Spirochaetae bacterium HGW-Spirochaetae-7]|jgi:amidohydrolase|nr:MAG: amidohydrolase [Spirochaetae bacterium HGW-Spirochaetae-7]